MSAAFPSHAKLSIPEMTEVVRDTVATLTKAQKAMAQAQEELATLRAALDEIYRECDQVYDGQPEQSTLAEVMAIVKRVQP